MNKQTQLKKVFQRDLDHILYDLIIAEQLLEMLDDKRANDFKLWIEIGSVLFNISEGHDKGLKLWIDFSMRSDKFQEGVCEKHWNKMEKRDYTLGTLKFFAHADSPNEFESWKSVQINHVMHGAISMAHSDIAKVLYMMFEGRYICDIEKEIWYEFKSHHWQKTPKGISLRWHLSHTLMDCYIELASDYLRQSQQEEDPGMKQMYHAKVTLLTKLVDKLKNSTFKNCVMEEAMYYFYDKNFVDKMNKNLDLIVYENGVYDSKNKVFRDGLPEDYCTSSTKLYYEGSE